MNQMVLEKQSTLRFKIPIVIISVFSLIFTVLGSIRYFIDYEWVYCDGNSFYEIITKSPKIFDIITILLNVAPSILLIVYILKFHQKRKATFIVPIILGLMVIVPIYYYIVNYILGFGFYTKDLIYDVPIIITFTLATIDALNGLSKKIFLIIAVVAGLIVEFIIVYKIFSIMWWYIEEGIFIHTLILLMRALGAITFYVALLLFGLKNRIPSILSISSEVKKENIEKLSPEQALKYLKEEYEFGMITEEEYQAHRTEIIRKL